MVVHTYNPSTVERLMQRDQEFEASWSTWDWLKEIEPNKIVVFPPSSYCCCSFSCSFHLFVNKISETLFTMRLCLWLVLRTSYTYVSLCLTTLLMHGCFSSLLKLFGVSLTCCCFNHVYIRDSRICGFDLGSEFWTKEEFRQWSMGSNSSLFLEASCKLAHSPSFPKCKCCVQLCHFISFKFPCPGIVSISQST